MTNTQSKIPKNATQIVDAPSSSDEPEFAQLSLQDPLPITDVSEEVLKECIICYESLNTNKNICITECGHEFCFSCMMKHVQRNNGCPMCRSAIIEEVDTDQFSEGEYDEDDDATIEEEVEELSDEYPIENLVAAFEAKGYGLIDALSLLMYKFSRTDPKYTKEYINKLQEDIEDMNEELQDECEEREHMEMEDANMIITAV
jgi:hypothetical protein